MVSKNDLLDEAERSLVSERVAAEVPQSVKTLYIDNGEVDIQLLTGIDAATEERIEAIHTHHDHHHHHEEEHDHAHDHFSSFVLEFGAVDGDKLQQQLQTLIAEFEIYRVKGFVDLGDKPMRQVVQGVGKRIDSYFDRPWQSDEPRRTQLVVIGRELNEAALRELLGQAEL